MGARYSPDGECLMVFGSWGCKVYESATGELLHTLVDREGAVVLNCCADASSKYSLFRAEADAGDENAIGNGNAGEGEGDEQVCPACV